MSNHTVNGTLPDPIPPAGQGCDIALECWVQEHVFLTRLIATLIVFIAAWALVKIAEKALVRSAKRIARHQRKDEYQTKAMVGRTRPMRLVLSIVVFIVSALGLLAIWGLQTAFTGLLAGAGFAGIVIGLAAADTIGDVIAGFLIFYNHPFDIGDWVLIQGVEGIVEDVALGATTLITFDNEKVMLPNRLVEGGEIKNFSHARVLRRRMVVGVEYGSHLGLAMATLERLAKEHPQVLDHPAPSAVSKGFGSSSVDLELRFYVEPVRSNAILVYTDLVHQTHDTFFDLGIKIAFPHMQIVQAAPWRMDHGNDRTPGADAAAADHPAG